MKTLYKILLLIIPLIMISSCSKKTHLTGIWEGDGLSLTIVKEGEIYLIHCKNPDGILSGDYVGKFEDGEINIGNSTIGNIMYSKESDKLFFAGVYLVRTKYLNR